MNLLCLVIGIACAQPLCINGRPAHRSPDITYAGWPSRHGYQRDHWPYPLCLGQTDTADHVRYQPLDEAHDKDRLERYACESYCRSTMDLTAARNLFDNWPRSYKQIFGEIPPHAEGGAENR